MMFMEQTMFNPGDEVQVKQRLEFKPMMIVKSVDKMREGDGMKLLGITCMWFDVNYTPVEYRFSSKDLVHVQL